MGSVSHTGPSCRIGPIAGRREALASPIGMADDSAKITRPNIRIKAASIDVATALDSRKAMATSFEFT